MIVLLPKNAPHCIDTTKLFLPHLHQRLTSPKRDNHPAAADSDLPYFLHVFVLSVAHDPTFVSVVEYQTVLQQYYNANALGRLVIL